MSQMEVYEVLRNKRLSGIDKFFSQSQISSMILDGQIVGKFVGTADQKNISRDLRRLHAFGILDQTTVKGEKVFRIKSKILSDN